MKEQLLLLTELQQIDSRISEFETAMRALPEKLAPAKRDLAKLEEMLEQEKTQLAEAESWRKEQEELINREEEDIKRAKVKLQASKNNREFAAASREMDNKRRSIAGREDEILKVIQAIENTRASIETHAADVNGLRERVDEEEKEISSKVETLQAEMLSSTSGRDEITGKLDAKILKKYDKVRRGKVIAVVLVKDGVCQGCHMALPPQLNNILAGFDTIELCPNCHRIAYRAEIRGDEEEMAQDAS